MMLIVEARSLTFCSPTNLNSQRLSFARIFSVFIVLFITKHFFYLTDSPIMIELRSETIWFEQRRFEEAESQYQRSLVKTEGHSSPPRSSIVSQIAKARETIKQTLEQEKGQSLEPAGSLVGNRLSNLEKENQQLKDAIKNIQASLSNLEQRVANIEVS